MPGNPGHVSSACVAESKEDESKKLIKCAMTKLMLASSRLDTQWLMLACHTSA